MRRWLFWATLLLAGMAVAWIAGCGDDDSTNSPSGKISAEDSTFITEFFDEDIFLEAFQTLPISMALLVEYWGEGFPKVASPLKALQDEEYIIIDDYSHTFNPLNGWHVFEFTARLIILDYLEEDTVYIEGVDSIMVLEDGEPVVIPTLTIDGLRFGAHADWDLASGDDHGDINHHLEVEFEAVGVDTFIVANGTVNDTLQVTEDWEDHDGDCWIEIAMSQQIDTLRMAIEGDDDCPETGHILVQTTIDAECTDDSDSLTLSGNWTVEATVNANNTVTITFSGNNVSWTITETCGSSMGAWSWETATKD